MVGTPPLYLSAFPIITLPTNSLNSMLYLPHLPRRKINRIAATSTDAGNVEPSPPSGSNNPLPLVFDIPCAVLLALSLAWLKGFQIRSKFRKYTATFEFSQASGISTGTPVRIRGVTVGDVIRVNPSLTSIEAVVEIEDDKTIIPCNSLVEVNQSGLLMETIIDITPRDPLSIPSFSPSSIRINHTTNLPQPSIPPPLSTFTVSLYHKTLANHPTSPEKPSAVLPTSAHYNPLAGTYSLHLRPTALASGDTPSVGVLQLRPPSTSSILQFSNSPISEVRFYTLFSYKLLC
ncbi:hypothetical protein RYX36_011946 [Vicia faba]